MMLAEWRTPRNLLKVSVVVASSFERRFGISNRANLTGMVSWVCWVSPDEQDDSLVWQPSQGPTAELRGSRNAELACGKDVCNRKSRSLSDIFGGLSTLEGPLNQRIMANSLPSWCDFY